MQRASLPGILHRADLARAYASMDAFVFPSATDTFGNVALEAMASGVPAIVTHDGGPKYLVSPGENGQLAGGAAEFARWIVQWSYGPERLAEMRLSARETGERFSWMPFGKMFTGAAKFVSRAPKIQTWVNGATCQLGHCHLTRFSSVKTTLRRFLSRSAAALHRGSRWPRNRPSSGPA